MNATMASDGAWCARLPAHDAAALSAVRLVAGLELSWQEPWLWLRGPRWDEDLAQQLRFVPGLVTCSGQAGAPATPHGQHLPIGQVPSDGWRPLRQALAVTAPRAGFPAAPTPSHQRPVPRLVREDHARPCEFLLLPWTVFAAWIEHAPEHRLLALRAVVSADGSVLLRGQPLPPLPGTRHWRLGALVLPAGWTIAPLLDASDTSRLAQQAGLAADDLLLVTGEGWQVVAGSEWTAVTRAGVRSTRASDESAHE